MNSQRLPQKAVEKLNLQVTTASTPKNEDTLEQAISSEGKPSKRYRGICSVCKQPKPGRGEKCWSCYSKERKLTVRLRCLNCGKGYEIHQYERTKQLKREVKETFCSDKCSCQYRAKEQRKRECPICKGYPPRGKKYCSVECKKKGAKRAKTLKDIPCAHCNTLFTPKSKRSTYCSRSCANKAHAERMTGAGNSHFKDGTSYTKEFQDSRAPILERDNFQCQMCGEAEVKNQTKRYKGVSNLHIHHIDHNPQNNDYTNLITLCITCHIRHHKTKK